MNADILLSIIIPAYQVGDYINVCIDSLLDIEIEKEIFIVVDSWQDPTVDISKKYTEMSVGVTILLNDGQGMSEARNTGFRMAKGKYVWFVDADDWICGSYNTILWAKLQEQSPEIVMFDAKVVNETNQHWSADNYIRKDKIKEESFFSGIDFFNQYYLKDAYRTPVWLNIFSKTFLEQNQLLFLEGYAHEDEDYTFRAILSSEKILYLGESFYVRRYRQDSAMTSGFHEKQIDDFFWIMKHNTRIAHDIRDDTFHRIYERYLYDRINVLIDRICASDSENKERWYREVFFFFRETIMNWRHTAEKLSETMMLLETIFHLKTITDNAFDNGTKEVLAIWREGVEAKIDSCLGYGFEACLGIYGTGKHTKMLFPVYEKVSAEKGRKLVFIDSAKESYSEKYEGYDIVNIKDVDKGMEIIISSFFHQNEIYETIRDLKVPCTIIKIYD